MTVLHLFAKSCQASVLIVGPTWPWWKYSKGDVWPYLITLRLAVAVTLIIKILSVCIEQTLLECVYFSHFCVPSWAGGCSWLDQRPFDVCQLVCCLKWTFSSVGDDFEKLRQSWYGSCKLALLHSYGSWCLEKPHRLLWKHQFLYW